MEKTDLINKIQSTFIINYIFKYIKNPNFILKFFLYSKLYQNKLDLEILYQNVIIHKCIGFKLDNYLSSEYINLDEKYQQFLSDNGIEKEEFENLLYKILKRKESEEDINEESKNNDEDNFNDDKFIDVDSPLFNIISKTKFLKKYSIYISQRKIDSKSKEDYIELFNKLNNSNIKYESICYSFNDIKKLQYLIDFKIDFNNIKEIILNINENDNNNNNNNEDYNSYFLTFFTFNAIKDNLSCLNIKSHFLNSSNF